MSSDNPLLARASPVPFDRIRPEHVVPAVDALLEQARRDVRAIADDPAPPTWANTVQALEDLTEGIEYAMAIVGHLESVVTTPALREAHNIVQPRVSELYSTIPLDAPLWRRIKAYAETAEARALSGTRARLLRKTVDSFRRHGADLPDDDKARLARIDVELSEVTTRFCEHVVDATATFELVVPDVEALAGLPASALGLARASAAEKGQAGFRLTLQEPSVVPALTYLDDSALRRTLWSAYNTRASAAEHDNRELVARILRLRRERAQLLGYASFVDLVLEDRMAGSAARARSFVEDLRARTAPFFRRETEELWAFRRRLEGPTAPSLEPWDIAYYAEKLRQDRYEFDSEQLRPYFPVDAVLSGLFRLVERLYGVEVRSVDGLPTWHPDVRSFELRDGDRRLGVFFTDLAPREQKRGGAWQNSLVIAVPGAHPGQPQLGVICANLAQAVGDRPALLSHQEVEVVLHEFGHLMHHLLTEVEVRSLAATNVAWDFVELPSQIMENWGWERDALDLFARHHETGERLPEPLFERMQRARTFRAASAMMRQLGFAAVDLALHVDYDPERDGDPLAYGRAIQAAYSPAPLPDEYAMLCSFLHLFGHPVGYAGAYYSYKWAEVLDADAFTAFRRAGIFSREVGGRFRSIVLARGDSRDPAQLYREFMGRDPDLSALLERSGLVEGAGEQIG